MGVATGTGGDGAPGKQWWLRFVLELEPTGRDTEVDGDEGKEGSRTAPEFVPQKDLVLYTMLQVQGYLFTQHCL